MARRHTVVVAALLALSAVAGSLGLARTLELGAASAGANDAHVAAQERRLNAFETSLRRQLAGKPAASAERRLTPPRAQRIRYVRPNPIVVSKSSSSYEDEPDEDERDAGEAFEHEGEDDD